MPEKIIRRTLTFRIPVAKDEITGTLEVTKKKRPLWRLVEYAFEIEKQASRWTLAQVGSEGRSISCRSGCSVCCRQPVPLSPSEAMYLRRLMAKFPHARRKEVMLQFQKAQRAWRQGGIEVETPFHAAKEYFALGIYCPFLVDHSCSIHAHRPLACREHSVTSPSTLCGSFPHPSVRMAAIPYSVGDSLRRACAKLLNSAPVAIPLIFFSQANTLSGSWTQKFREEEMARCLIEELGGTLA